LNPDKPNDGEDIVIVRAFDAHMVYLRRQEETTFLHRFPNMALKSGSANPDSLHTRYECDATYPEESWLSGTPMWNCTSVTSSSFIVTKPGIDGMVEGSFILLRHREMRNTNINPESFSSTKNGRTSVSFHRMFYFMAVEASIGLDFKLLEMLSTENHIYEKEPIAIRNKIDHLRKTYDSKSVDELREICKARKIIVRKRNDITERGWMVLCIARDIVQNNPDSSSNSEHQSNGSTRPRTKSKPARSKSTPGNG
jgi:hypothetical protein